MLYMKIRGLKQVLDGEKEAKEKRNGGKSKTDQRKREERGIEGEGAEAVMQDDGREGKRGKRGQGYT